MSPEMAERAYLNLLKHVPVQVADRLTQKYEADRATFIEHVQKVIPSTDPGYWAKRSCTRCYGRGILGELTAPNGEKSTPSCSCTNKNYEKWLVIARHEYNQQKEMGHEEQTGSPQTTD